MDHISTIIRNSTKTSVNQSSKTNEQVSDHVAIEINFYNDTVGELDKEDGIQCDICKNRGYIAIPEYGWYSLKECTCMSKRQNKRLIKASGLGRMLTVYTMNNFQTKTEWQESLKKRAINYINLYENHWFYIGGQNGSGKTHICSAIVIELIEKGIPSRYMIWRDEIVKIKQKSNTDEYNDLINKFKKIQLLYIDDFFKSDSSPSAADINIAFEILNYRYNNNLPTIISSEMTDVQLLNLDESIASRIIEKATSRFMVNILEDKKKNIRLGGSQNGI